MHKEGTLKAREINTFHVAFISKNPSSIYFGT
jgi:hypothetical protein